MEMEEEKRRDTQEPEGSAKRAIPADGEGINPDTGRFPKMELLMIESWGPLLTPHKRRDEAYGGGRRKRSLGLPT